MIVAFGSYSTNITRNLLHLPIKLFVKCHQTLNPHRQGCIHTGSGKKMQLFRTIFSAITWAKTVVWWSWVLIPKWGRPFCGVIMLFWFPVDALVFPTLKKPPCILRLVPVLSSRPGTDRYQGASQRLLTPPLNDGWVKRRELI